MGSPKWPDPGQGARSRPRHAERLTCTPRLEALLRRGVTDGGRGDQDSRTFKNRGCRLPRNLDISVTFFLKLFFAFSNIFILKWPKSEEKLNFGGRWVWVPMNPTPPQSKLRGDALAVTSQHPVTNEKFRIYILQWVLKYYWMGWLVIASGNSTGASTRHVSSCAPHFLPCCFGIGCTFFCSQ